MAIQPHKPTAFSTGRFLPLPPHQGGTMTCSLPPSHSWHAEIRSPVVSLSTVPARAAQPAPLQQALGNRHFGKSNLCASAGSGECELPRKPGLSLGCRVLANVPTRQHAQAFRSFALSAKVVFELLWFLFSARSSAKAACGAGLPCVGRPGWVTHSVVNKLCLLLSLHPAHAAVITELYFLDTWK